MDITVAEKIRLIMKRQNKRSCGTARSKRKKGGGPDQGKPPPDPERGRPGAFRPCPPSFRKGLAAPALQALYYTNSCHLSIVILHFFVNFEN